MRMRNTSNTVEQLALRIDCNQTGSNDLDAFLINAAAPRQDDRALDLGCGSGKQLKNVAPLVSSIVGLDLSPKLIEEVGKQNIAGNIRLVVGSMDNVTDLITETFTLVYSCYALYYSSDVNALVNKVSRVLLEPTGRFFVVSPDAGNNEEWFFDLQQMYSLPDDILYSQKVTRDLILPAILDNFGKVTCMRFENIIEYHTLDQLMNYYDGCGSYCRQDKRGEALEFFGSKIAKQGRYCIRKCAMGMLAEHGQ